MKADCGHLSHQSNEFGLCSSSNGKTLKKSEQGSEMLKVILDSVWRGDLAVWVGEQESLRSRILCHWAFNINFQPTCCLTLPFIVALPILTHTALPEVGLTFFKVMLNCRLLKRKQKSLRCKRMLLQWEERWVEH